MEDEHFFDDERDDARRGFRVAGCGLDVFANVESVLSGFARKLIQEFRRLQRLAGAFACALDVSADKLPAAVRLSRPGPDDPPIPNEIVQKIFAERFQDRIIQRGHVTLDMAAMAEDGRYVPVIVESDLPMTADNYVKAVYLVVDHNPEGQAPGAGDE